MCIAGLKEQALAVATDAEQRFDLSIQLDKLDLAYAIASELDHENKWKIVGDAALNKWQWGLAEECMKRAFDFDSLLLFYQAAGNGSGLIELAQMAKEKGKNNVAFSAYLILGEVDKCLDVLIQTDRLPEAALMARSYAPSQMSRIVKLWKDSLLKAKKTKTAGALADPDWNPGLFPDLSFALFAEDGFKRRKEKGPVAAAEFAEWKDSLDWDIVSREYFKFCFTIEENSRAMPELKQRFPNGPPESAPPSTTGSPLKPPTTNGLSSLGRSSPLSSTTPSRAMSCDRKSVKSVRSSSPESRKPILLGGGGDYLGAPSTVSTDDVEASETMSYLSMEVGAGSIKVCQQLLNTSSLNLIETYRTTAMSSMNRLLRLKSR